MRGEKLVYILTQVSRRIQLYHSVAVVVFFSFFFKSFVMEDDGFWNFVHFTIIVENAFYSKHTMNRLFLLLHSYSVSITHVKRLKISVVMQMYMNHPYDNMHDVTWNARYRNSSPYELHSIINSKSMGESLNALVFYCAYRLLTREEGYMLQRCCKECMWIFENVA